MSSASAHLPSEDKFADFTISIHTYKIVEDHPILVDVAIPKNCVNDQVDVKKRAPICVELHGGWLVCSAFCPGIMILLM